jgi:hypothetical protein
MSTAFPFGQEIQRMTVELELTLEERAVIKKMSAIAGAAKHARNRERKRAQVLASWPEAPTEEIERIIDALISGEMRTMGAKLWDAYKVLKDATPRIARPRGRPSRKNIVTPADGQTKS